MVEGISGAGGPQYSNQHQAIHGQIQMHIANIDPHNEDAQAVSKLAQGIVQQLNTNFEEGKISSKELDEGENQVLSILTSKQSYVEQEGELKHLLGPGGEHLLGPGGTEQPILGPGGEHLLGPGGTQQPTLGPGGTEEPILGPGGTRQPTMPIEPILGPGGEPPITTPAELHAAVMHLAEPSISGDMQRLNQAIAHIKQGIHNLPLGQQEKVIEKLLDEFVNSDPHLMPGPVLEPKVEHLAQQIRSAIPE